MSPAGWMSPHHERLQREFWHSKWADNLYWGDDHERWGGANHAGHYYPPMLIALGTFGGLAIIKLDMGAQRARDFAQAWVLWHAYGSTPELRRKRIAASPPGDEPLRALFALMGPLFYDR